jgi:hypothetical protein
VAYEITQDILWNWIVRRELNRAFTDFVIGKTVGVIFGDTPREKGAMILERRKVNYVLTADFERGNSIRNTLISADKLFPYEFSKLDQGLLETRVLDGLQILTNRVQAPSQRTV